MRRNSLIGILLLLNMSCEKQFTYCDFRYKVYILKNAFSVFTVSPLDDNFNIRSDYREKIQYYVNQGYTLDSTNYNKYFCKSCSEEQHNNAMKYGAYCVSN
jgi:hypothetical protein